MEKFIGLLFVRKHKASLLLLSTCPFKVQFVWQWCPKKLVWATSWFQLVQAIEMWNGRRVKKPCIWIRLFMFIYHFCKKKKDKEQTIGTPGNSFEESFEEETYSWERLTHRVVQVEHGVHFRRVPEHTCQGLSFNDFWCLKLMNSMFYVWFWYVGFLVVQIFSSHNVQFCHGHLKIC